MNDLTLDDLFVLKSWTDVLHIEDQITPEDRELLGRIQAAIAEKEELAALNFEDNCLSCKL